MWRWYFLSSILQEHSQASLYSLATRFQDTDQKHARVLLTHTSVFNNHGSVRSLHLRERTCVLTVRCRWMNPHSTLPPPKQKRKNPEGFFTQTTELGKATALGFSGVSTVLSSVFPPGLSCSLTSEYKQETFPSTDTTQSKSEYSQSGTRLGAIGGPLFFLWWTSTNIDLYNWIVYSVITLSMSSNLARHDMWFWY